MRPKTSFKPAFFKISLLKTAIGLAGLIRETPVPVTFNQLMKCDLKLSHIFIFDESGAEVPMLISYCGYFGVKLYRPAEADVSDVKSLIGHARMVCIPLPPSAASDNGDSGVKHNVSSLSNRVEVAIKAAEVSNGIEQICLNPWRST